MKLLPALALAAAGAAVSACGSASSHRGYDHDIVYRSTPYDHRYYYDEGVADPLYYQPGYGAVPATRRGTLYDDGYYYYRD